MQNNFSKYFKKINVLLDKNFYVLLNNNASEENFKVDFVWVKREGLFAEKFSKHKIELQNWSNAVSFCVKNVIRLNFLAK